MSAKKRTHQAIGHAPRRFDPTYRPEFSGKRLRIGWRDLAPPVRHWQRQVTRLETEHKRVGAALKRARENVAA